MQYPNAQNVAAQGAAAMGMPSTGAAGQSRFPGVGLQQGLPGTLQQQLAAHGGLQGGFGSSGLVLGVHGGQPFGLGGVNGLGGAAAAAAACGNLAGGLGVPPSALAQGIHGGGMVAGRGLDSRSPSGNPLGPMGGAPPGVNQMQRPPSTGAIGASINGPRVLPGPAMGPYAGAQASGMGDGGFPPRPGSGMLQYGQAASVQQGDLLALINSKGGQPTTGYGSMSGPGSMGSLSTMGSQGDEADSAPFDPSEFPSLSVSQPGSVSNLQLDLEASYGAAALGHKHSSEFSIQNEDFPALPGALKAMQQAAGQDGYWGDGRFPSAGGAVRGGPHADVHQAAGGHLRAAPAGASGMSAKGISGVGMGGASKSSTGGDRGERFGLLGLLNVIRMSDVDLSTLALGTDLTTLGLNLNQSDMLYKTFSSPWAEGPGRPEPDLPLPACYFQQAPRLLPAIFTKFSMESLFYVFYSSAGEEPQRLAAEELLSRGWMWHKEHKVWLARVPGMDPNVKTDRFERGSFLVFDPNSWDRVRKDNFVLQYDMLLEGTPRGPLRRE